MWFHQAVIKVLKAAFLRWFNGGVFSYAGALAYTTLFSLGPTLLLIVTIAGFFFGRKAAETRVFEEIQRLVGTEGAQTVQILLKNAIHASHRPFSLSLEIILFLLGATTALTQLKSFLNEIFSVTSDPETNSIASFLKTRFFSLLLIIGFAFLLLISLVASGFFSFLEGNLLPGNRIFHRGFSLASTALSFFLTNLLFTAIFRFLPDLKIGWRECFTGGLMTSALFLIGKSVISLYIGHSSISSVYGVASSLVVVLVWIYYSSLIVFFGALFLDTFLQHHGIPTTLRKNVVRLKREVVR